MFALESPVTVTPHLKMQSAPRVLVVDDEPVIRMIARMMLERGGFAVEDAADAEEAVRRVQSAAPFGVILLDYTLPGRTGAELLPELRRLSPHSRVVLTSGRAEDEIPAHGADGYLAKPFTREQLLAAVGAATPAG